MADEARSRLGRGLAALIGDVGAETPTAERARTRQRARADRASSAQSAQPAPHLRGRRTRRACRTRSASAASSSRSWCARAAARKTLRDHRRRAALARGAARRPARRAGGACSKSSDGEALELAIIENVQRADLNPLEEAAGYQALATEYSHSQDDIAQDRRQEPQPCRQHAAAAEAAGVGEGLYQRRQAVGRPCARADRPARSGGARARDRREGPQCPRGRSAGAGAAPSSRRQEDQRRGGRAAKDADTAALEKRLSDALGLAVSIDHRGNGGVLRIRYRTLDQLDEVVFRLLPERPLRLKTQFIPCAGASDRQRQQRALRQWRPRKRGAAARASSAASAS